MFQYILKMLQWAPTKMMHDIWSYNHDFWAFLAGQMHMTSKYKCIANCSHRNHWIWSQELWEPKILVLKTFLLFYSSMVVVEFPEVLWPYIQWFQLLKVVIHHRYVTQVWSHKHWSIQKCLEVILCQQCCAPF